MDALETRRTEADRRWLVELVVVIVAGLHPNMRQRDSRDGAKYRGSGIQADGSPCTWEIEAWVERGVAYVQTRFNRDAPFKMHVSGVQSPDPLTADVAGTLCVKAGYSMP